MNEELLDCVKARYVGSYEYLVEQLRLLSPDIDDRAMEMMRVSNYGEQMILNFTRGRLQPKPVTVERFLPALLPRCSFAIVELPEGFILPKFESKPIDEGTSVGIAVAG